MNWLSMRICERFSRVKLWEDTLGDRDPEVPFFGRSKLLGVLLCTSRGYGRRRGGILLVWCGFLENDVFWSYETTGASSAFFFSFRMHAIPIDPQFRVVSRLVRTNLARSRGSPRSQAAQNDCVRTDIHEHEDLRVNRSFLTLRATATKTMMMMMMMIVVMPVTVTIISVVSAFLYPWLTWMLQFSMFLSCRWEGFCCFLGGDGGGIRSCEPHLTRMRRKVTQDAFVKFSFSIPQIQFLQFNFGFSISLSLLSLSQLLL